MQELCNTLAAVFVIVWIIAIVAVVAYDKGRHDSRQTHHQSQTHTRPRRRPYDWEVDD